MIAAVSCQDMAGLIYTCPQKIVVFFVSGDIMKENGESGGVIFIKDQNCGYCMRGELLDQFGIYICDLSVSSLILFKEQDAFMDDVARAANALHKAFRPDKVNYGAYGDTGCHLHMHLVPKYKGGDEWGGVFQMNPQKTYLSEEEYEEMIRKIKENL